jgi:hypothetical protein
MSAKTESTTRPGLSTLLKNKIGKLNKKITSRSKSSPALMMIDSNIQSSLVTIANNSNNNKPRLYIKEEKQEDKIPHCSNVIDLS